MHASCLINSCAQSHCSILAKCYFLVMKIPAIHDSLVMFDPAMEEWIKYTVY